MYGKRSAAGGRKELVCTRLAHLIRILQKKQGLNSPRIQPSYQTVDKVGAGAKLRHQLCLQSDTLIFFLRTSFNLCRVQVTDFPPD